MGSLGASGGAAASPTGQAPGGAAGGPPRSAPNHRLSGLRIRPAASDADAGQLLGGEAGRQLPTQQRRRFESALRLDLSAVRVHSGPAARHASRNLGARAFTLGRHIAFGRDQYDPDSAAGARLLGHELVHVVQQRGRRPWIQRADEPTFEVCKDLPKPKSTDAQPLVDRVQALCLALEKADRKRLPTLVFQAMRKLGDPSRRLFTWEVDPVTVLPAAVAERMAARLLVLGLESQSQELRWYVAMTDKARRVDWSMRRSNREMGFWSELVKQQLVGADSADPKKTDAILRRLLDALERLVRRRLAMDEATLKLLRASTHHILYSTEADVADVLEASLSAVFVAIQRLLQSAFDRVIVGLEAGGDLALLKEPERLLNTVVRRLKKTNVAWSRFTIKVILFDLEKMEHLDFFEGDKTRKSRRLAFEFFTASKSLLFFEGKKMDIASIIAARFRQLNVLRELYGEHRSTIKKLPKRQLRLHNVEDWRRFAVEKFKDFVNAGRSPEDAFISVAGVIERYLQAFTLSTPYNVLDIGGPSLNYLTREYPQGLTGQIIHDCGVYALRVAYILSLLRTESKLAPLGLEFRYILLPNHIGLLITSAAGPLMVLHNDTFTVIGSKLQARRREHWRADLTQAALKEAGLKKDQLTPKQQGDIARQVDAQLAKRERQFIADWASAAFFLTASMPEPVSLKRAVSVDKVTHTFFGPKTPYAMEPLPAFSGSGQRRKERYWRHYKGVASRVRLFKDPSKIRTPFLREFNLRYLAYHAEAKRRYNRVVRPIWNELLPAAHRKLLEASKKIEADPKKGGSPDSIVSAYLNELDRLYQRIHLDYVVPLMGQANSITAALDRSGSSFLQVKTIADTEAGGGFTEPPWVSPYVRYRVELNKIRATVKDPGKRLEAVRKLAPRFADPSSAIPFMD